MTAMLNDEIRRGNDGFVRLGHRRGQKVGHRLCLAIARALGVPAEVVLHKAGRFPEARNNFINADEWLELLVQLNEKNRKTLLLTARKLLQEQD